MNKFETNSPGNISVFNSTEIVDVDQTSTMLATLLADGVQSDYADFKKFWEEWFTGKFGTDFYTLVEYKDNVPAGVVRLWKTNDIWLIEGLYVPQAFRRQGIAEKLLTQAIEVAKENKIEKIFSNIKNSNSASINLHTKLGFTLLEEGSKDSFGNFENDLNKYILDLSLQIL